MMKKGLSNFFEEYLTKNPLFVNKKALQGNFTPDNISHRDEQIKQLASILAPALRMEKPSNVFLYGKTGTGKTCVTQYITSQIFDLSKKKNLDLKICYLNCKLKKVADTEYRLMAELARNFDVEVPATGLPTEEVYKIFVKAIDSNEKKLILLILDEIDQLVSRVGDGVLYNLTRLNSELKNCELSVIGISNDLLFTDDLDPRIKSSLSEEELVFPPYNAIQLQDILRERSAIAFRENVIESGVIEKCAAYAAREHGDARRALELLRVSGELAERSNSEIIKIKHIDEAEEKIEKDTVLDVVKTQPKQSQIALYSILKVCTNENHIFTGDVYDYYKDICRQVGAKSLTQRRISDIIAELDMFGIIHARVVSKGRYGRTKEITLGIPLSTLPKLEETLKEGLGL
ncbi:ORC1-type DNA replication protein [Candidatus Woesearchaeota archaeon]|nr:ORC1-type DNA replication protein [Candidatus Woesearchaeota archaeon]